RFWPFVGMGLLVALITFGVVIVVYFVLIFVTIALTGLFAAFATVTDNSGIAAVGAAILLIALIFVMTFLLLLPFAYLSARWLVAPVVVLVERCGPTGALKRSWRLTEGSFWRLFGLLVLLVILNGVVLGLPLTLLQFLTLAVSTPQLMGVLNGVLTGVSYLVSILWYPFMALTLLLVYYDLRVRKENYDLLLRIQALEQSVRPTTLPTS
ncbi:MAG: glycerophosphoryl diester phosphodiesterase membrane domain-containing protein, partial [Caldilinea sp.]